MNLQYLAILLMLPVLVLASWGGDADTQTQATPESMGYPALDYDPGRSAKRTMAMPVVQTAWPAMYAPLMWSGMPAGMPITALTPASYTTPVMGQWPASPMSPGMLTQPWNQGPWQGMFPSSGFGLPFMGGFPSSMTAWPMNGFMPGNMGGLPFLGGMNAFPFSMPW